MKESMKVAQYGCGKMAAYTMRYVYEKGGEIVAAFDVNPDVIGRDIGEIMKSEKKGVVIQPADAAPATLAALKPHACIITTLSLFKEVYPALAICAQAGVNAVTTCEEAFFPWNSSPALTAELDALAKKTNCTLCGSGYQDVFWGNLVTALAGSTQTIRKIRGKSSYNVEDYGIALAKAHGAGLDLDAFQREIAAADAISDGERQKLIAAGTFLPSYMWNVNGWLCDRLGLTIIRQTQKCVPQVHDQDLASATLGLTIPAGHATGMSAVVTTETEEGIILENECIGKVYAPSEFDRNDWTLEGEPQTRLVIDRPATVELTCAAVIARLNDLAAAPAGYISTGRMPPPRYCVNALTVER